MSEKQQRIVYQPVPAEIPATYPAVIRIDPVLPCFSCSRPAAAALATMVYRLDETQDNGEIASGEWLIKPICGTCAESETAQYAKQERQEAK